MKTMGQPAPCAYRDLSDDAVRIDAATGKETSIEVWLCSWTTTLGATPPWHRRRVGGGIAIDPETDCENCPVRKYE
jgi:hypothetical protein